MKPKEQRYLELYEQVKMIVEVSESEARLAKLFPQTNFQLGKQAKEVEALKKKNIGKKGKYHSVVKMKRSSVVGKQDPEELPPEEMQDPSMMNDGTQSPEETIRAMQDPVQMAQELMAQGMQPEEVAQYLVSQGMEEDQVMELMQQIMGQGEEQPPQEKTDMKA
jgi:hypothetical protein